MVIVVLVGFLVLAAGAAAVYGGHSYLLKQQRDDYAAGHAAYLKADCTAAQPRLAAAQESRFGDGLDEQTRTDAARDQKACQAYLAVQARAAGQPTEKAMSFWLAYTIGKRADPLIGAARTQLRTLTDVDITKGTVSSNLCTHRENVIGEAVRIEPEDNLAAPLLAACGRRLIQDRSYRAARKLLVELQTDFGKTPAAKSSLGLLATASDKLADTADMKPLGELERVGTDRSLQGAARIRFVNLGPYSMEVSTGGARAAYVRVPPCRGCAVRPHPNWKTECGQKKNWGRAGLTVPARTTAEADRVPTQVWFINPSEFEADYSSAYGFDGKPRIEPNGVYEFCGWVG